MLTSCVSYWLLKYQMKYTNTSSPRWSTEPSLKLISLNQASSHFINYRIHILCCVTKQLFCFFFSFRDIICSINITITDISVSLLQPSLGLCFTRYYPLGVSISKQDQTALSAVQYTVDPHLSLVETNTNAR